MNKYDLNSGQNKNDNCVSIYILYLVLFLATIYLIYKFIYFNQENFQNSLLASSKSLSNSSILDKTNQELITELNNTKKEINDTRDKILKRIEEHDKATYIAKNFNKISAESFYKELNFIESYFRNNNLPTTDLSKYKIISNQSDLDSLIFTASNFKNIYKPGDLVTSNSTFDIDKNKICYQHKGALIKDDPSFMTNYPSCMVCSVNPDDSYNKTNSWFNTKTNIKEVCLFNPNSTPNSGIPNLDDCKKFCGINNL